MDTKKDIGSSGELVSIIEGYQRCLKELERQDLKGITEEILNASTVYTAGNGGSAEIASHFASDLSRYSVNAICLTDNTSRITAIGNDFGYQSLFIRQLHHLEPTDVVVLISSSGRSPNILAAAKLAHQKKGTVIGFTGWNGGDLVQFCDYIVALQSQEYGEVEGVHSCLCHILIEMIRESIVRKAHEDRKPL